jgi:hypothetical protein
MSEFLPPAQNSTFMRIILITIFFYIHCTANAQTKEQFIVGEWIEVRRENRDGYVFNRFGRLNDEPGLELTFNTDGSGVFYNKFMDLREPFQYRFNTETTLVIGQRRREVVHLDKSKLILIFRLIDAGTSDMDIKSHFIRKEHFQKLSDEVKRQLAAPTTKDLSYRDSLFAEREHYDSVYGNRPKGDYLRSAQKMPSFPGGAEALQKFVKTNTKVPDSFIGSAKVDITFIVEPTGQITQVRILNGLQPKCDVEALRVVSIMPKWIPGENDGKKVRVLAKVSVSFASN